MTNAELFNAMQSGTALNISSISRSVGVPNCPARIVSMQVESGERDVYCWNLSCREVSSGREFKAFVRTSVARVMLPVQRKG